MMTRRSLWLGVAALSMMPQVAVADPIFTSWRNNRAVGGYDVMSFYDGKPLKGRSKYTYQWDGVLWRFANARNMDRFIVDPQVYKPAFGGYCAWAVANGKLAAGNPDYWAVIDDRLYLTFNRRIYRLWDRRREAFISAANVRWPELAAD